MLKRAPIIMWVLLLLLTAAILLYPVEVRYDTRPIQSPYIFPNLPLFALLYLLWLGLLLGLIFLRRGREWESLALVGLFALVFLGFWVLITPDAKEGVHELAFLGDAQYIQERGELPPPPFPRRYLAYPNLYLLTTSLSQVTGIDLLSLRLPLVLVYGLIFTLLLFVLFRRSLGNSYLASIAVVLLLTGDIMMGRALFYQPLFAGLVLAVLFLVLLYKERGEWESSRHRSLMLLVLASLTIAYSIGAYLIPVVLLSVYGLHRLVKLSLPWENRIALAFVVMLAWQYYWASNFLENDMIGNMVAMLQAMREDFTAAFFFLNTTVGANVGASLPLWANATRIFWWLFIFIFGALLGLRNLMSFRKLSFSEKLDSGGFLGVVVLTALATALLFGAREFFRYLLYGGFFLVPILLRFLLYRNNEVRQRGALLLLLLLFLASFPTFLAHNGQVSASATFPQELAVGRFVKAGGWGGEGWGRLYIADKVGSALHYYEPRLRLTAASEQKYDGKEGRFKGQWEMLIATFEIYRQQPAGAFFVFARSGDWAVAHIQGVSFDDPGWQGLFQRLESSHRIYDNEFVKVYR